MLRLNNIKLTHYKNYETARFEFLENVVGISGLNGKGKTNLLDAIYYCCLTKSYFAGTDLLNIRFDKDGFRLEADFHNESKKYKVVCIHRGYKKEILLNDAPYEKFSHHIGLLPVVIIAPDDIEMISGGSELRRKYIDTVLSQLDSQYLQQLIQYNKILQQRNSLLKAESVNEELLNVLDHQLTAPGNFIYEQRKNLSEELIPLVQQFYGEIAGNTEIVRIQYESRLHTEDLGTLLKTNHGKDRLLQRTSAGIHRDDLTFELNSNVFKSIASQGQRKSLLFALKLAEYELIRRHKGFAPILLLDDVFEKLDDIRMQNLLNWVCNKHTGQVFITDTHRDRLADAFRQSGVTGQVIEL